MLGVGKMFKDVGMVIHKALWCNNSFGCFFGFPSLHVLSCFKMFFLAVTCFGCFFFREEKSMDGCVNGIIVVL